MHIIKIKVMIQSENSKLCGINRSCEFVINFSVNAGYVVRLIGNTKISMSHIEGSTP